MQVLDKETLRHQLVTERNINKQLRHELEVKERCYQTVMNQRDEQEVKVKRLVKIIEDDLWPLDEKLSGQVIQSLIDIDV